MLWCLRYPRGASKDDIKEAHRKLALTIQIKIKVIRPQKKNLKRQRSLSYSLRWKRKANYDQFGHAAFEGGGGAGGFSFGGLIAHLFGPFEDFFSDFGGGSSRRASNRGNDLRYDISISLEDAYKITERNVNTLLTNLANLVRAVEQQKDLNYKVWLLLWWGRLEQIKVFTVQQTCPQCSGYGEMIGSHCSDCRVMGKCKLMKM